MFFCASFREGGGGESDFKMSLNVFQQITAIEKVHTSSRSFCEGQIKGDRIWYRRNTFDNTSDTSFFVHVFLNLCIKPSKDVFYKEEKLGNH